MVVGVIIWRGGNQPVKEYTTTAVVRQDLTQTVSATGSVKTADEAALGFGTSGKITRIAVKVGDQVKIGQQLAAIDTSDLAVQLRQYQANVASAKANLAKVVEGATPETIAVAQQQVDNAQAAYTAALVDLANAQKNKDENLKLTRDIALNDLGNYLFKGQTALDTIEQTYSNSNYDGYLSAGNFQLLTDAKAKRTTALAALAISETKISAAKISGADSDISTALQDLRGSLLKVSDALDTMFSALQASVTSVTYFSDATLESLKTSIKADQTAISTGLATIKTDLSGLQTTPLTYDNAIDTAQNAVNLKQQALDLAKAQYQQTVAAARSSDVAYYAALVQQAEAQVAAVQQKFSDRVITAPTAGVITKVDITVGEYASPTVPAITLLTEQQFEIDVDVPESDIAKIKIDDQAAITLDAFGNEVPFTAKVALIEPAQTEISGVVYYKVKMYLDPTDQAVKPGMTANVDIRTDSRTGVLVIPQRAVTEKNGVKTVQVMVDAKNNIIEDKTVATGLRGDDGLIEVLTGLTEGQQVVTFVKEVKK